jgi:Domain of Unknown Function (DUF1259)
MKELGENGIEVTAPHNHLLRAQPVPFYMHVRGHGGPARLAAALREAVALSKTPLGGAALASAPPGATPGATPAPASKGPTPARAAEPAAPAAARCGPSAEGPYAGLLLPTGSDGVCQAYPTGQAGSGAVTRLPGKGGSHGFEKTSARVVGRR